jgi:hypothetical protein
MINITDSRMSPKRVVNKQVNANEEWCGSLQEPHGVTSQKTPFFIVTAVKTSNITSECNITVGKNYTTT